MDARSLDLLEFPQVRARLAELTSFPPSRRLAEALVPENDPVLVARSLDETDQARALRTERAEVGVGAAHDIGPWIERAVRGGRLDPEHFLEIAETLDATSRLATSFADERRPLLRALGRELHPLPALRSTLGRSFDPVGELLDTASPRLGGLRAAVRVAYDRLRRRLDALVGSELGGALQEPIVTLRNGRYVVPVKAEARSRVKGIVHDASGSGQTLFVEPLVAVELGNAWREAQAAEREEVERILDELSALVAASGPQLRESLAALARFDFWAAKGQLAAEMDGVRADTADRTDVVLLGARHPGLTGRVVAIDVRLGDGYTALVVTGPNTGGKTVTLRTLGLLALMHQAGLHVPAQAGSRLPVFRDVFADIGDEQSIAQSLSTFSGHLRRITRIVEAAGPNTLVLLDELGAGTDPTEGSALAQALLDHFIRAGALVAATTHYAELKAYAHTTDQARNASVEFDLETLSPTYRLRIGLPGGSQAFAIAERLGLPGPIVADARSRLTETQQAFEETLARIKAAEGETSEALERARAAEARAADALRHADDERRRARRERDDVVRTARVEAERLVDDLRDEVRTTRRRLERETVTAPAIDAAVARAEDTLGRLPQPEPVAVAAGPAPVRRPWQVGERARSRSGGWEGRIAALEKGGRRATLEAGGMRVSVGVDDLEPAVGDGGRAARRPAPAESSSAAALQLSRARTVASSLDLRGARVDEALDALGRYLDDAALAGLERVTIIHGLGTGALRDAVRAQAGDHPQVKGVRPGERGEGGDGATVLSL
ncbi:MAG TPA: endonuclease MutS2 [Candidatus Limnocylindrales bacterium]|jgi:DNA mismatch repair protein MutS2|nr:endonuclease MutS2 [Candidatus Limnocylindrales bacterium]